MPQVSVGQVENLKDALGSIERATEALTDACQSQSADLAAKAAKAEGVAGHCTAKLEVAREKEVRAAQALEAAEGTRVEAAAALMSAESVLSSCEAQGSDEDENPPDCTAEADAVADAAYALNEAENAVVQAAAAFEEAKACRIFMEARCELSHQAVLMVRQLGERVQTAIQAHMQRIQSLADTGRARLRQAAAALDAYIATNPAAAQFAAWVQWTPPSGVPITPREINARLSLSPESQRQLLLYLADRDPAFRSKLVGYSRELCACRGTAERHAVQLKIRRNLSGDVAERLVSEAFRPLAGKIRSQVRTDLPGGKYTMTDLVLEDLKVPVILGRGEGMSAKPGESIAIEIKCGKAEYLYAQKDHMVYQSGGHAGAAASVTVCSRNIKDLGEDEQERLRKALREAGSPLAGMLPRKEEIDKVCWDTVLAISKQEGDEL